MRPHRFLAALTVAALVLVGMLTGIPSAHAHQTSTDSAAPGVLPNAVPSSMTPQVDNGAVWSVAQVGNTLVMGGTFTSIGGQPHDYIAAIDASTGAVRSTFKASTDGQVYSVQPGPNDHTVYVGGSFTQVDGQPAQFLTMLDTNTGQVVPTFKPPTFDYGMVRDMVVAGGRLYVGGFFGQVGGKTHHGLAALNANTGALDPFMGVQLAGHHNSSGSGAQGRIGTWAMDASPDGTRLVAVGDFATADGLPREQLVMIDLGGTSARVDPSWATNRYSPLCYSWAFDGYVRGVSFSPDGKYFVVNATGGGNPGTLCDATSRFETGASGTDIQPTWVDETGGDTVWGVTVTSDAVFIGGHNRWNNNPHGIDTPGPGAVPRPGLAALDPVSGRPYSWNPGHNPLGAAVYALLSTPSGLWMAYDSNWIGNYKYKREKIAFFPYAGGSQIASTALGSLPGTVYLAHGTGNGQAPHPTSSLTGVAFDGSTAQPAQVVPDQTIDWGSMRGAFTVGDQLFYGGSDGELHRSRLTSGGGYGAPSAVDPYHDPYWDGVDTHDGTTFDGTFPQLYGQLSSVSGMFYADGRLFFTMAGDPALHWAWFTPDSGIVDDTESTVSSSVDFSRADGMFLSGNTLYYVDKGDKGLHSVAFSHDSVTGTPTLVDDPAQGGNDWTNTALYFRAGSAPQPAPPPPPANQSPTAAYTSSCTQLDCTFDGSGSADPDGTIAGYSWDFGDGSAAGSGATPSHSYTATGDYTVKLTVTDNGGATDTVSHTVSVIAPSAQVGFVGVSHSAPGVTLKKTVTIPSSAQPGDTMVLVFTDGKGAAWTAPGAGWTPLGTPVNDVSITSQAWTRQVAAGDPGTKVTVSIPTAAKAVLSLAVYSGLDPTNPIDHYAAVGDSGGTSHTTPAVATSSGDWVASWWTDKSAAVSQWTPAGGLTTRDQAYDTGTSGRFSTFLADSGGPISGTSYPGLTATTDATSAKAIMWAFALRPQS